MSPENKIKPLADMTHYDAPGLMYDSGVLYDVVPPPQPLKRMAQIKINFKGLSDLGIIQQCTNIKTAMTGNANFTTPTPTLTAFGTLITTAQAKLTASDTAQQTSKLATADKDATIAALLASVKQLSDYVSMVSAGDGVKIQSAGFSIKAAAAATQVPDMVHNLAITAGDNSGELDLQWDPTNGAKTYDVQTSPDPITPTSWVSQPSVSKSKAVILGLPSGAKMWLRVRAVGAGGIGAWSDVATKIVP